MGQEINEWMPLSSREKCDSRSFVPMLLCLTDSENLLLS